MVVFIWRGDLYDDFAVRVAYNTAIGDKTGWKNARARCIYTRTYSVHNGRATIVRKIGLLLCITRRR